MNGLNVLFEKGIGLETLMLANVLKALFKAVCVWWMVLMGFQQNKPLFMSCKKFSSPSPGIKQNPSPALPRGKRTLRT